MKCFITWQLFFQNLFYAITAAHWNVKTTVMFFSVKA